VLRNGVDLRQFRPRSPTGYLHRELNIPAEAPLVGDVGQIGLRKGQDVLMAAATALAGRLPEFHCLFVGRRSSGKEESRRFESDLRAAARGPLTGRVHFVGQRCDIEALLPELTLLVHVARQEPLGRVLLEAAACGVAVIATDVGGTREIFPPATCSARLVSPDRPDDLAAAMAELLGDPSERRRLGIAARRRAEAAFDVRDAVAGLVEHYRAVPGGRALRPLPDRAVAGLVEHYRAVQRITAPAESPSTGSTRTSRRDRPARGR
jgi:glycosyltransferase involved in cell wall biosynthesis